MKTIKFFSLAVLLSLAWVACKDNTAATTEETTQAVPDSVFVNTKNTAAAEVAALQTGVTSKIAALESALAAAAEADKPGIQSQLDTYKKFLADLQAVGTKVSEATAENWSAVTAEVESVHIAVKTALTAEARGNMGAQPPAANKLTN